MALEVEKKRRRVRSDRRIRWWKLKQEESHNSLKCEIQGRAAFDTVNHKTPLSTLKSLGIHGTAWEWFASYLEGRSYQSLAIRPLQMIQNAAARLVFNLPKFSHTTPLLRSLHWLPVAARIRFKNTDACLQGQKWTSAILSQRPHHILHCTTLSEILQHCSTGTTFSQIERESSSTKEETKWKGSKARNIGGGFKLFYHGVDGKRNGVGVILKEEYSKSVVEVKKVSDRVMNVKLEVEGMINVISAYAPQVGCEMEKERFWSELDEVVDGVPRNERLVIGADFNGHVGGGNRGDEEVWV
ncbi:hypothetical protein C0J45_18941 [Silurus meridionalis]|nr:hypothetical protein C0J45_18941 [Silurus meridionalis]